MTRHEAAETCDEVFAEYLPKMKKTARDQLVSDLLQELQERGLELEEDGYELGEDLEYDALADDED
jgi:hypothetical protein